MKILFMTNVPAPYRVDFFNELGKSCDLTVTFEKKSSDERGSAWDGYKFENFTGVFLKGKSINTDTAICPEIIRYVGDKSFDHIICADFSSPTGMIATEYMRMRKIPYWLESDGGFAKSGRGLKEKVKRHFISGAHGYFSTAKEHDNYYIAYGADPAKIHRYPFTSLKKADLMQVLPEKGEKDRMKSHIGIREAYVVLAVGQFIPRKGFDILLRAARELDDSIGIYIVGGKPTEEYLKYQTEHKLNNVHFCGYKAKAELKKYYLAADVFVHPTREDIWGLVINEAMACALPVITTDKCIAGMELLGSTQADCIIPSENSEILAERIQSLYGSGNQGISEENFITISEYTIEGMIQAHLRILGGGWNSLYIVSDKNSDSSILCISQTWEGMVA